VTAVEPAPEATGVPLDQTIRVQFDRWLAPVAAIRQSVCIRPFGATIDACLGGDVAPEYDPVDRVAVWRPGPLAPDVRYSIEIRAPKDRDDPFGIRAFDGAPLDETLTFGFTTAHAAGASSEPRRDGSWCGEPTCAGCTPPARDVLRGCATAGCHDAAARLRLDGDRAGVWVGRPAWPTARLGDPRLVHRDGAHFGIAMPWIDATSPGNSWLLYALLVGGDLSATAPSATARVAPWIAWGELVHPARGETDRLREVIVIDPDVHRGRVTVDDARTVGAWIASGAATPSCP
jgi:hypothetical protein